MSAANGRPRTVVTGLGVVAPNGIGTDAWWRATCAGTSGIRRISRFDPSRYATRFAGEVVDFEPTDFLERRLMVQCDRWTWMGLAATQMALEDAAIDPAAHDPYSMSVITASCSGGNEFGQAEIEKLWARGPGHVGAYQSIAWFYAATTGQISIRHGMKGHSNVVVAEGAGGLEALAHSRRTIRRGTQVVVSGGVAAPLSPYALACQLRGGRLTPVPGAAAYRPFDAAAGGHLPGEGGAILIAESLEHARRRGAPRIYGEIAGYGATHDAAGPTATAGDARHLARAIRLALDDARVRPGGIDAVFADGAGTPDGDRVEVEALRAVFGDPLADVPVTVPKSMVGRLYAGGAALDTAGALLALRDGCLPPTINLDRTAHGEDLDVVRGAARPASLGTVLVVARGYGGFNAALVLRRVDAA
jgi:minimal PKS chain-length factor (CLF/KS beta)